MLSRIRRRLTYANVAMIVALVFAMSSGAYAASKYVITSTKQISPKVLKALQGKNGKPGSVGPVGPAGPAGSAGAAGAKGENGALGLSGKEGKEGLLGKQGELGKSGELGKEGSPWTAKGTLPVGSSEHGVWLIPGQFAKPGSTVKATVSFPIPLASKLEVAQVHYIGPAETAPPGCLSGTVAKPEAESGNLCVYSSFLLKLVDPSLESVEDGSGGAGASGAMLNLVVTDTEEAEARGDWVVTG
jgi:hypothetical protein